MKCFVWADEEISVEDNDIVRVNGSSQGEKIVYEYIVEEN